MRVLCKLSSLSNCSPEESCQPRWPLPSAGLLLCVHSFEATEARKVEYDMIFGPAYKGIPLVAATAVALFEDHGVDLPYAYNRKEKKDHGEGGTIVGAPLIGRVLVIDDVITAGTAAREAAGIITAQGAQLGGLLIALDRQERGADTPLSAVEQVEQDLQVPVVPIVTLTDLILFLERKGGATYAEHAKRMRAHQEQFGSQARQCDRRRALSSAATGTQEVWLSDWRELLECWWIALPVPTQTQLGSCMGALGISLASSLDASWRVANGARSFETPQPEPLTSGCEWVGERLQLPEFPSFPTDKSFSLPPIPQLLPSWQHLQGLVEHRQAILALSSPQTSQQGATSAAVAGAGAGAVAAVFLLGLLSLGRRFNTRRAHKGAASS